MTIDDILKQPDGSLSNITVNLDELPLKKKYEVIPLLLNKCALNGTVSVVGLELFQFAKDILNSNKTVEESNAILETVNSLDTLDNIKRFLLQFNFKTVSAKRENGYYVCATRHSM